MATSLLFRPDLGKRAYRLKCRFRIEPCPSAVRDYAGHMRWMSRLEREKVRVAEWFVQDMHKPDKDGKRWENLSSYGFRMRGPFPYVAPMTLHSVRTPSAREMLSQVMQGARFLDNGDSAVRTVPKLSATEWWEFELSGVFARDEILMEYPDPHEEEH